MCQKAGGRLSQLAERLESMMPDPKEALGKRGMRKARELERRQVSLRHKLRETQGELQKVGEGYPAMKRLMKGMLEGAGTMMERAAKRLGEGQPKKAAPHQEDALERLRQAQKQIQDSLKHGGSPGGGGMEAVGPEPDHERIGIPGKEDFKAPRAFRDLLMRTMKERAPGQYEKALEQYYKELAK